MELSGPVNETEDRVVTIADIKTATKVSCMKKWQRRWNLTNSGRGLYAHRKVVGIKRKKKMVIQKYPRVVSKLRTGCCLNEYLQKIGVVDTPYCKCGEIESCFRLC